jgi:transposase
VQSAVGFEGGESWIAAALPPPDDRYDVSGGQPGSAAANRVNHKLWNKAYDSAELREELDERGTKPVIPNRCNRKQPFSFSKRLYRLRWRIENAFNRLKDFRRIATRYDRLALNYLASVCLAAALVWWI